MKSNTERRSSRFSFPFSRIFCYVLGGIWFRSHLFFTAATDERWPRALSGRSAAAGSLVELCPLCVSDICSLPGKVIWGEISKMFWCASFQQNDFVFFPRSQFPWQSFWQGWGAAAQGTNPEAFVSGVLMFLASWFCTYRRYSITGSKWLISNRWEPVCSQEEANRVGAAPLREAGSTAPQF